MVISIMIENLKVIEHPAVSHHLSVIRDKNTGSDIFAGSLKSISRVLAVEASRLLALEKVEIETPLEKMEGSKIVGKVIVIPILRAGLTLVEGFVEIIPDISVCHLGAYRDHETLKAHVYLDKVPPLTPADQVFLVDPMLATGNSAIAALDIVRAKGGENITLVNVLAAPEGVEAIKAYSGKVNLVLGAMDRELNDKGYILPGLGDAGDRAFNTQ